MKPESQDESASYGSGAVQFAKNLETYSVVAAKLSVNACENGETMTIKKRIMVVAFSYAPSHSPIIIPPRANKVHHMSLVLTPFGRGQY